MSAVSGVSPTNPKWVELLVNQMMSYERQPLATLENQRDSLNVKDAIYTDITTKITDLQSAIEALNSTTYGINDSFTDKAISVVNANPDVNVANVSLSGTSAVPGTYDLTVTQLATAHQIGSAQQAQSNVGLGVSGTFVIGGASASSVSTSLGSSNPVTAITTSAVASGETQLGSGAYYVEFQDSTGSGNWQFRLVDEDGQAVRIDDASDTGTATTDGWQDVSTVAGTTFDTGRGLSITFDSSTPTRQLFGDANMAGATYTAQGASVTVAATDSLNDIRDAINSATYADGNAVQATIVDRRLVITGTETGASATITLDDTSGTVLQSLGILSASGGGAGGTLAAGAELQAAKNAKFNINGINNIERSKNTGLTDIVQGLSFDLKEAGSATITISKDNDSIVNDVKDLLTKANDVMNYIKAKTEPTKGADDENGNPTYTAAPLASDWSISWLRQGISSKLLGEYTGALGNEPRYLTDVGITINASGEFELSDSTALTDALNSNFSAVQNLFDDILTNLDTELDKYVDGTGSILSTTQDSLDNQLATLNDRIDSMEERLKVKEEAYRSQYSAIQAQLISMTYQFQSMQAFSGSMINQTY